MSAIGVQPRAGDRRILGGLLPWAGWIDQSRSAKSGNSRATGLMKPSFNWRKISPSLRVLDFEQAAIPCVKPGATKGHKAAAAHLPGTLIFTALPSPRTAAMIVRPLRSFAAFSASNCTSNAAPESERLT